MNDHYFDILEYVQFELFVHNTHLNDIKNHLTKEEIAINDKELNKIYELSLKQKEQLFSSILKTNYKMIPIYTNVLMLMYCLIFSFIQNYILSFLILIVFGFIPVLRTIGQIYETIRILLHKTILPINYFYHRNNRLKENYPYIW